MRTEHRVHLTMSVREVVLALIDGNPGAINVCMALLEETKKIDPDAAMGGVGSLLLLDQHGIYGSDIWRFYKNVCGQSLPKMLACLRAIQLGGLCGLTAAKLGEAISDGVTVDVDAVIAAVRQRLPQFAAGAVSP